MSSNLRITVMGLYFFSLVHGAVGIRESYLLDEKARHSATMKRPRAQAHAAWQKVHEAFRPGDQLQTQWEDLWFFELCFTEPFRGTPVGGHRGIGVSMSRGTDQVSSGLLLGLNENTFGFKSTH